MNKLVRHHRKVTKRQKESNIHLTDLSISSSGTDNEERKKSPMYSYSDKPIANLDSNL